MIRLAIGLPDTSRREYMNLTPAPTNTSPSGFPQVLVVSDYCLTVINYASVNKSDVNLIFS